MVSIWRWAVTDDLQAHFAKLMAACPEAFAQMIRDDLATNVTDAPSLDQVEAENEAKLRGMNLPPDILEQTLAGFKEMMAEARAEEADGSEEDDGDLDPDGPLEIGLAGSHMFFEDPFASLGYEEIEAQVQGLLQQYIAAISAAAGHAGQGFADFLGATRDQLCDAQDGGAFEDAGFDAVHWLWPQEGAIFYLSLWQEDKELPIDIGFGRVTPEVFAALKSKL